MKINRMKISLLILLAILATSRAQSKEITDDYDATEDPEVVADALIVIPFTHFCKFDLPMLNHSTTNDDDFCDCDVVSSLVGHPIVNIDCEMSDHVKNLTNTVFRAEKLPINTVSLTLSYQHFREVPNFIGEHLKHLDMSNNLITIIKHENFIQVTSLEDLDLSYNSISDIQVDAFKQLQHLHYLDLSSNRIVALPVNVFAPLVALETLKLSSNVGIAAREGSGKPITSIYQHFGVTTKLNSLVMTHSGLTSLDLRQGDGLKRIHLSYNNFTDFATIALPGNVESLELSGNPIYRFTKKSLPSVESIEELVLEDMPHLTEFSLFPMPKLHHLTLEGSKSLSQFKLDNNGSAEDFASQLKILNLRGCGLKNMDQSLESIISQLEGFHLEGNPFQCDCDVKWMKQLEIDMKIQCDTPESLNGRLLAEIPDKKLKCENVFMNRLINTLILLFLLVACSLAIWFFLRRLNPSRRNKFQKVGPESPYQRVTIEPNRAEYSLY